MTPAVDRDPATALVSVAVPVFNESAVLPILVKAIEDALRPGAWRYELILVDDGSTDGSGSSSTNSPLPTGASA